MFAEVAEQELDYTLFLKNQSKHSYNFRNEQPKFCKCINGWIRETKC